jgi:integrase
MAKRRSRGDGGLHWDESRKRWIATASLGYDPSGKRIVRRTSGRTKTEAKDKLKEVLRDYEDGLAVAPGTYTVKDAVTDWLTYGLHGQGDKTRTNNRGLCKNYVIPDLGARKLRDLSATDVDKWLTEKATQLSTRSLQMLHSCLNRSVKRAMARDKVKRNVVELCTIPQGRPGRPSKSLTLSQAEAVLRAVQGASTCAYVTVSLLTGARPEELRALTWDHVDLLGRPDTDPPVPPHIAVWRSVRAGGDTKTRKSRRTIALPSRCIDELSELRRFHVFRRRSAGSGWNPRNLVFCSEQGTALDASHVRRAYRRALQGAPGIKPTEWTPRELRHSFVSLLSDRGVPLEDISRLVGHSSTAVTELVYRKQIRPVIQVGAIAMDQIFAPSTRGQSHR